MENMLTGVIVMAGLEYISVFFLGAAGYGAMEFFYRGFTHWTMPPTGGLCFLLLYIINTKSRDSLLKKCVLGTVVITTVELLVGYLVNLSLGWNVWDYSHHQLHLGGQICLSFTILWFFICIPCHGLCLLLKRGFLKLRR